MKTKEILKEWRNFLKEEKNKSPDWIIKQGEGGKAIYNGKEVEIIVPDLRGDLVLIRNNGKEESVHYNELKEPK
tara:strand:+ start:93 stop:314 length:222 start_codon:yes stop_codon:yes gene_type:complete